MAGSLVGAPLTSRVSVSALGRSFGVFVPVVGVFLLTQELPSPLGLVLAVVTAAPAGLLLVCRLIGAHRPLVSPLRAGA
ncbi:hypothetical protein PWG71_26910 [Nocardiopsis sp. N85]|uniref:hypothetical protein n=1 Tax=Nocardiopsis sp. N85 TaxID=3029400 RepID=UPI00237F63B6|nr:hypothetical protein [Nocardiopsis sp. N85]MDE3725028.1 hypothetical protein [Nocardiopsis sp. N85]